MDNRLNLIEAAYLGISVRRQCELLGVKRSSLYYQPEEINTENLSLLRLIDEVFTKYPFFETRKMVA